MAKLETSIHVRVSDSLYKAIQEASKRIGVTNAWLVRHATQKYLSQKGFLNK